MTCDSIIPGHIYRSKAPREAHGFIDDRLVLWVSSDRSKVQFTTPSVPGTVVSPTIETAMLAEWAGADVTATIDRDGGYSWERWRNPPEPLEAFV